MTQFPNAAKGLMWIFWGEIVGIVCELLRLIPVLGVLGLAGQVVSCALILLGAYRAGCAELAARGVGIWKVYLGCMVVLLIFLGLVMIVPLLAVLAGAAAVIGTVVVLVVMILYIAFLYQSGRALSQATGD